MGKIVFITGGVRSGKSNFAIKCVKGKKHVLYIATYRRAGDREMEKRIKSHIKSRPGSWKVIEEAAGLNRVIGTKARNFRVVLVDCLTLWVSNLILAKRSEAKILKEVQVLMNTIEKEKSLFILVSNEVGTGVVPDTKMGRKFRDIAGRVNQIVARTAGEVYLVVAGIPLKIK